MPIVIDDDLRTMTIPTDLVLLGVESDDDVMKIPFQMPRMYHGYDLSLFEARVNYMNAKGEGDIYIAQDLTVEDSNLTFTWIVGRNACKYKGDTKFIVCLKKFDSDAVCIQEFNTTVYKLPVLEGLETIDAVEQENADIIEQILQMIDNSGMFDPSQYYTKSQVDARIPSKLPNPYKLTIDGTEYDGSETVTMETNSIRDRQLSGKTINIVDAVPGTVNSLKLYDSSEQVISSGTVCVANKNLFRIDALPANYSFADIMVKKRSDHGFKVTGTAATKAGPANNMDAEAFEVGKTYTISSGKSSGFAMVILSVTYDDSSHEDFISVNSATTFTIEKKVTQAFVGIGVDTGVTVDEIVYPQIEAGKIASAWVDNEYEEIAFTGSNLPELPDVISNLWSKTASVAKLVVDYKSDTVFKKIDEYVNENVVGRQINGSVSVSYDGLGTVSIGVG